MVALDWIVLIATLLSIVLYGMWKTRKQKDVNSYLRGEQSLPWYHVAFGIMATQASAITFLSAPGQAYTDGMRYLQIYLGMPIAMIVICIFFIKIYRKYNVYTAYELLENRFDKKTRLLTAFFFLFQRGLAAGLTIYAPSLVLSAVFGWDLFFTNLGMGGLVILYTVSGGTKAVAVTQFHQMMVIIVGMAIAGFFVILLLPEKIGLTDALYIAGGSEKLNVITSGFTDDGSFDWSDKFNIWSGIIGGFFLALSYFGTDQSQVGRYLSGKSASESKSGLLFNAILKIPMQFSILLIGALLFAFFQFYPAPMHFNSKNVNAVMESKYDQEYQKLNEEYIEYEKIKQQYVYAAANELRKGNQDSYYVATWRLNEINAKIKGVRKEAGEIIKKADPAADANDTNYIFLHYVITYLPAGLIGLLIAVIFCASWSSTAAELNALATTTVIDVLPMKNKNETQKVSWAKWTTVIWGAVAIFFAEFAAHAGNSLLEAVNIMGSLFYGTILGVFLVAFFIKHVKGHAVFIAALVTEAVVICVHIFFSKEISFLWYNAIGAILVMILATGIQVFMKDRKVTA
jgi:SSS family solute:Na+ symporter